MNHDVAMRSKGMVFFFLSFPPFPDRFMHSKHWCTDNFQYLGMLLMSHDVIMYPTGLITFPGDL